ncbi:MULTISPECIES: DUF3718 domain-containing protein [Pseudoalteromonas]|uniref:DUF3718 domain-containing protein n=1 Tax=Pseudoalteromonas TaxID=53246 RepID=UPI00029A8F19|nr:MULTISPECIES: DUF3718 domain-containing protein [Pseudoalteromonas]MBR8844655.1 DUF3718 domain-containing protein [Pseudoalteromonas sp. JC3]NSY32865.1 DUF3718 domain-containing protein [Pseudoalteromonas sp. JC28]QUI70774.1 DUF3718 domain-containing protein [Pseudoalteromonas sp. M8]UDM61850.1 DUF3718 domain-containing protein [Pseudoalteromonas piscicida]WJE10484.1 DUF3718 domain-containing protein [Pseudoalteromonas sp. JC3]
MKLLNLVCATSLLVVGTASAADFVAADDSRATKVCMSVVKDNRIHLFHTIKDNHLKKRVVEEKLHCNDMPIGKFAATYGFNKAADFLGVDSSTRTSIKDIAQVDQKTIFVSGSK